VPPPRTPPRHRSVRFSPGSRRRIDDRDRRSVLGAGFGGLELCTLLSESLGESIEVTLIDKNDHFVFGFSKLDIMFGHAEAQTVRLPYANFAKSGVQLIQQTITKIDPGAKRVITDEGSYTTDYLVVALGADYDWNATPGLAEVNEFYTTAGAERLRDVYQILRAAMR
jgi:sulfide:quinone oxidoreductase